MTKWMLDASVFVALVLSDDPHHEAAMDLLDDRGQIATIDLAYYETMNVALRGCRRPELADPLRLYVSTAELDGGLVRLDHDLLAAAAHIASRYRITVYDAAYAAAARRTGAQLVSCDIRDLVSNSLAITPTQAVAAGRASDDG